MYACVIKGRSLRWGPVFQPSKHLIRSNFWEKASYHSFSCSGLVRDCSSHATSLERHSSSPLSFREIALESRLTALHERSYAHWKKNYVRTYSSGADGRNTSDDKHLTVKEAGNTGNGKRRQETVKEDSRDCDVHARMAEQDQKEWLNNEWLSIEYKKKESPFLTRHEKFRNEFLRRVVPWEKIHVSLESFPYYINEHSKNILVECVASHLKNKTITASYGARLASSSGRILLQSVPGTELYRERIVRALARDLQVPLLILDSRVLAPCDLGDDCTSESESEDGIESGEECTSESEVEDENDATNEEEWTSSTEARSDCSDDDQAEVAVTAEAAIKKLMPYDLEEFEKRVSGEADSSSETSRSEAAETSDTSKPPLRKGDRVKYIGPSVHVKADDRIKLGKIPTSDGSKNAYTTIHGRHLSNGQRGEVYEVNGDLVAVILDITSDSKPDDVEGHDSKQNEVDKDEKRTEQPAAVPVYWIDVKHIEHDLDIEAEYCYIAMEALCEVLQSIQPSIVYFPDSPLWLSRAVSKSNQKDFLCRVQEKFDQLSGPVVLICGQNKVETGSKEKEKFTMILPNFSRLAKQLPFPLKRLTEGLKGTNRTSGNQIYKLFSNVLLMHPPKEEELLQTFNKQVEEDRKIVISRSNLTELHKVLEENEMSCSDLLHVDTDGVILTKQKAEKVLGWAKNHYLMSCPQPNVKGERLLLPRESLEIAIMRLKEQDTASQKPSQNLKSIAKNEYESNFISAVVPPGEIGVKFDNIGALEEVKKALNELVILPMRRPELFSHGNLLRPCKGILLFGPPGTGKTLLAKALATEAGANFISITGSTLTSKWFGDAEKLTKALFSFASKLAPVIIFVDEVDSLLGARGGAFEHEATRRMRNEFMAAWDGLRSKDSQRILILGATNRPYDLDDAVIRRLPRRIYVDLPDAENRMKILRVILTRENLEPDFQFDKLANATEGYSGSDLKNLSIAAAYRPVEELLKDEKKECQSNGAPTLRPLSVQDFIQSKAKVGPSVAFDAASMNELRKWNEQYGEGGSRRKSPFGF